MATSRLCSNYYFFWRRQALRFQDDIKALEIASFNDGKSTQQFLAQFKNDYYAISGLRGLLSEERQWIDASRFTGDQVLAEIARLILAGELGVALRPYAESGGASSSPASGNSAPLPAAAPVASSKSEEPDPATFPPGLNGAAQAAALAAAASSGAAFCPT